MEVTYKDEHGLIINLAYLVNLQQWHLILNDACRHSIHWFFCFFLFLKKYLNSVILCFDSEVIHKVIIMSGVKGEKRINSRVMKWRQMIQKGVYSDLSLLIKRTRKGIPPCIRIKVWPEIVKVSQIVQSNPMTYSKVLLKDSHDVYDINLDIPRTFSFQSQQVLRTSLFNVLKALSIQFPRVGYCQGMNFLAMRMLETLDDEVVFYIISTVISKYKPIYDNLRNPGYVNRQNQVFTRLLEQKLPKIHYRLKDHGIEPVMYTPSWFLTLFSKSLSKEKFYRFFQCFLVEGYAVIFKTALALMKLKEDQFLSNQMEGNLMLINDMTFYDSIDDDQFINTIFSFELSEKEISAIEGQFNSNNKPLVKKLEESIDQAYKKKLIEPRNLLEWTLEDYKRSNANLVDFNEDTE